MKKAVLFLFASLLMMGCKKDDKSDVIQSENTELSGDINCLDFSAYDTLKDSDEKAEWLRNNGKDVCPDTLYKRVKKDHTIKKSAYTAISNQTPLQKTWNEIKKRTDQFGPYEKYVSFSIDSVSKEIVDIIVVSQFTDSVPCFSLPLFRSIAAEHNGSNITFEFKRVRFGTTLLEGVVFNVLNENNAYYDYSNEPKHNIPPVVLMQHPRSAL